MLTMGTWVQVWSKIEIFDIILLFLQSFNNIARFVYFKIVPEFFACFQINFRFSDFLRKC